MRKTKVSDSSTTPKPRTPSAARIAANKANGLKSTGPRTAEGKERSSQNALKHGLRSERNPFDISTQIPGEQTHLTDLLKDFDATYQPANPVELQLVIRLAQLTLRLNRAASMESAALDKARAEALRWAERLPDSYPDPDSPDFETHILADTLNAAAHQLKLLTQYESRLSRDFARTLTQLRQSQNQRTANALCAPSKRAEQTQPAANVLDPNQRAGRQVPSCAIEETDPRTSVIGTPGQEPISTLTQENAPNEPNAPTYPSNQETYKEKGVLANGIDTAPALTTGRSEAALANETR